MKNQTTMVYEYRVVGINVNPAPTPDPAKASEQLKVSKEFIGYKSSPNSIRSCSVRSSAPGGQKIKVVFFSQKESFPRQCKDILYLYPDEERLLDYCLAKTFSFLLSCTNQIERCHWRQSNPWQDNPLLK